MAYDSLFKKIPSLMYMLKYFRESNIQSRTCFKNPERVVGSTGRSFRWDKTGLDS